MKYSNQYITINNKQVKQVNKTTAKKLYDSGIKIYLHPCNMMLNNCWMSPMPLDNTSGERFKTVVNGYEYYNCNNELGSYCNFFTEVNK